MASMRKGAGKQAKRVSAAASPAITPITATSSTPAAEPVAADPPAPVAQPKFASGYRETGPELPARIDQWVQQLDDTRDPGYRTIYDVVFGPASLEIPPYKEVVDRFGIFAQLRPPSLLQNAAKELDAAGRVDLVLEVLGKNIRVIQTALGSGETKCKALAKAYLDQFGGDEATLERTARLISEGGKESPIASQVYSLDEATRQIFGRAEKVVDWILTAKLPRLRDILDPLRVRELCSKIAMRTAGQQDLQALAELLHRISVATMAGSGLTLPKEPDDGLAVNGESEEAASPGAAATKSGSGEDPPPTGGTLKPPLDIVYYEWQTKRVKNRNLRRGVLTSGKPKAPGVKVELSIQELDMLLHYVNPTTGVPLEPPPDAKSVLEGIAYGEARGEATVRYDRISAAKADRAVTSVLGKIRSKAKKHLAGKKPGALRHLLTVCKATGPLEEPARRVRRLDFCLLKKPE